MRNGSGVLGTAAAVCRLLAGGAPLAGQTPPAPPASLQAIVVPANGRCVIKAPAESGDLGAVWAVARTGLAAVVRTEQSRQVAMDVDLFERTYDKSGRKLIDQQVTSRTGVSARPVTLLSATTLRTFGYAHVEADGVRFFAPDATVLASDEFGAGYCMRLHDPLERDSVPGGIGIAFTPSAERPQTDIEGVLWLDRATGELRRLDYHYNRMPADFKAPSAGGRLVFRTLPKGLAFTQQWSLRLPIVTVGERRQGGIDRYSTNREDHAEKLVPFAVVTGFREFGGIVKRAEVSGAPAWTP